MLTIALVILLVLGFAVFILIWRKKRSFFRKKGILYSFIAQKLNTIMSCKLNVSLVQIVKVSDQFYNKISSFMS